MRCKNHGRAGAPRPSAESIKTERTAGVSPVQFNNICLPALSFPLRSARFQIEGKSVGPNVLSSAMLVMKYFVRFMASSRPGPHWGFGLPSDVAFHPGELFLLLEQRFFREWNQQVTVNLSIN